MKLLDPIFQGIRLSEKEKLGHRVLLLDDAGDPKAFLTPFVAKLVYAKYKAKIFGKSKALVQALSNISWAGSMVGMFFEPAFHDHVAYTDRKITVLGHDINILHRGNVGPQQLNANHKSQPPVALDTLYLPGTRVNDTFDSYILAQVLTKVVLHLIQVTVGTDHTGGTWDKSVKKVYDTAKNAYPNLDIVMVYAVPKSVVESFKVKPMSNVTSRMSRYPPRLISSRRTNRVWLEWFQRTRNDLFGFLEQIFPNNILMFKPKLNRFRFSDAPVSDCVL